MPPSSIDETRRAQTRYEGHARRYDASVALMERMLFERLRRRLWQDADASLVLEVGAGTGKNLPVYPPSIRIVALDLSPAMLRQAVAKAAAAGRHVDFVLADAESLPFPDSTFDAVVATCVFCSVPDPVAGLTEAGRVLKGEGRLLLLEHVRARGWLLGKMMDLLNPLAVRMGGENVNRDTVGNVRAAGFELEREESSMMGIVKLLRARRKGVEARTA